MGITWCRERLEQAHNSKNPVDRILIRCSNAMKPKTYARSQDRLADDIVYRGIRTKDSGPGRLPPGNSNLAPPRSRPRLRGMSDWHSCALSVPDVGEPLPSAAPVPPPRKKRKRKTNLGSEEMLNREGDKENAPPGEESAEAVVSEGVAELEKLSSNDQKRHNRFIKLSENKTGKGKADAQGDGKEERPKSEFRRREHKMKVVKNVSTVSLPNYSDLIKPAEKGASDEDKAKSAGDGKAPRRNQSSVSLPGEGSNSILSSLSEATIHRLETYMKRCRSFGSLKPQQLLEKLEEFNKAHRSASESSDSWSGLDDWDMGVIEYCDPETANAPPLTPKSRLPPKSNPIFSVGSPQETPRRQSPVSEEDETADDEEKPAELEPPEPIYVSMPTDENVPSDWFSETQKKDPGKLGGEKKSTKTPPPSPANGLAESEPPSLAKTESQPSLIEILAKYKDEELSELGSRMGRESGSEVTSVRSADDGDDVDDVGVADAKRIAETGGKDRRLVRNRSSSLKEVNPSLLVNRFNKRSPSIGFERTTHLLDELTRNSRAFEKELMNPELFLNGLRRASMYENLPEDPFEIYIQRKKPSLRESLTAFLGFEREQRGGDSSAADEKAVDATAEVENSPPPLPLNPPPVNPPTNATSVPLVTVTTASEGFNQ